RGTRCASTCRSATTGTATTAAAWPSAPATWPSSCAACSGDAPATHRRPAVRPQALERMVTMLFEPYRNEPFADYSDPETLARFKQTLADVEGQLGRQYPLVIGGRKVETGEWLESYDPSRKSRLVGRAAKGKAAHIEQAFEAAEKAYEGWSRLSMEARARTLMRLA